MGKASRRKRERKNDATASQGRRVSVGATGPRPGSSPRIPGRVRLSEAIVDVIQPYIAEANTFTAYQNLAGMGVMAWNMSLLPVTKRQAALDDALSKAGGPVDESFFREVVAALVRRKEELYPRDRRFATDFQVRQSAEGYRLNVASVTLE